MSDAGHPTAAPDLPWEPGSPSEVLAASHVLVLTVVHVGDTPWVPQASGLLQRDVPLRLRLDEMLKGRVRQAVSSESTITVPQVQEPGGVVSDYQGFWSTRTPRAGSQHLLLASSASDDLAVLMQEAAIRAWLPATQRSDVIFVRNAESRLGAALRDHHHVQATLPLLLQGTERVRAQLGPLAAGYVQARLGQGSMRDSTLVQAALKLMLAPDTSVALRTSLATGLSEATLDQDLAPAERVGMVRGLLALSDVAGAADLFEQMAATGLYNLVFLDDKPVIKAAQVIADKATRVHVAARLRSLDEERADALAHWLEKG
ncbi:MAG: hypothetical protein QM742_08300 [Aquabacterium sp.]